jgi:hypothetical protein
MTGLNVGGLALVAEDRLRGINVGGLAVVSGDDMEGINIGGLAVVSGTIDMELFDFENLFDFSGGGDHSHGHEHMDLDPGAPPDRERRGRISGITLAAYRIDARELYGASFAGIMTRADRVSGVTFALYNRADEWHDGVAIGLYNQAENLHGVQLGLLNYAGNNSMGFKYLPILNFHFED